ncbi:hypothetical protein BJ165DRAFT_1491880 [Panaeolus papilionaceus]|nr:hypothetical protein BJ165DRAFT_1491880 [Panaeolus papilionaceus]
MATRFELSLLSSSDKAYLSHIHYLPPVRLHIYHDHDFYDNHSRPRCSSNNHCFLPSHHPTLHYIVHIIIPCHHLTSCIVYYHHPSFLSVITPSFPLAHSFDTLHTHLHVLACRTVISARISWLFYVLFIGRHLPFALLFLCLVMAHSTVPLSPHLHIHTTSLPLYTRSLAAYGPWSLPPHSLPRFSLPHPPKKKLHFNLRSYV